MEKISIGGTKGKSLTDVIRQLHDDFKVISFVSNPYLCWCLILSSDVLKILGGGRSLQDCDLRHHRHRCASFR